MLKRPAPHPYLGFRVRLARHALRQFSVSLGNSLEIILLGFGPVLVGLLACVALPGMYAATQPWPIALALLAGQSLIACLPVLLLRKRLLPAAVLHWSRALPIPPALRWLADGAVAALIAVPLCAAYAVSIAIWLYQWPDWLRPVVAPALVLSAVSLLAGWLLATLVLAVRARMPSAPRLGTRLAAASAYAPASGPAARGLKAGLKSGPYYWRQLFWLPFWRGENVVGLQQTVLLAAALLSVVLWLLRPPVVPAVLWGSCASLFLMLLTDRGDKAVTEQVTLLRPVLAGWPIASQGLFRCAIGFSLLPGLCVLAVFSALVLGRTGNYSHTVATVWICVAAVAQLAVVLLRGLTARGRVALVIGSILILTAIGSELWN
ncbi:hypothetical protein ACLB1G_10335 [Oxalobacteraceae bacterium A2-2]